MHTVPAAEPADERLMGTAWQQVQTLCNELLALSDDAGELHINRELMLLCAELGRGPEACPQCTEQR